VHMQHATHRHQTSLQPTRYVFPNALADGLCARSGLRLQWRSSLCRTGAGCTSTAPPGAPRGGLRSQAATRPRAPGAGAQAARALIMMT
jgi:hypothetical protein